MITIDIPTARLPIANPSDERGGLPSGSAADRLQNCPGSYVMEKGHGQLRRYREDAERGTRIHAAWHDPANRASLSHDELDDLDSANEIVGELVERWAGSHEDTHEPAELWKREERMWLHAGISPVTSGQCDRIYRHGRHYLIPDLKTGWGDYPAPKHSPQLRVYALLLASALAGEFDSISVGYVRPGLQQPYYHTYDRAGIADAAQWWSKILTAVFSENPPLQQGEHCQFCKAQTACPARLSAVSTFRATATGVRWEMMTAEQKANTYVHWKEIEKIGDEITKRVREELAAGASLPGLSLGAGRAMVDVVDPQGAATLAIQRGVSRDELFTRAVKISYAQLRDLIGAKSDIKKKDYDAHAKALLGDMIETREGNPTIKIS